MTCVSKSKATRLFIMNVFTDDRHPQESAALTGTDDSVQQNILIHYLNTDLSLTQAEQVCRCGRGGLSDLLCARVSSRPSSFLCGRKPATTTKNDKIGIGKRVHARILGKGARRGRGPLSLPPYHSPPCFPIPRSHA
jgi:hypothetical protein